MTFFGIEFDRRTALLAGALALTIAAMIGFHLVRNQRIADVLAIIDITAA